MLFYNNTSLRMKMMDHLQVLIWCFVSFYVISVYYFCPVIAILPLVTHLALHISLPYGPAAVGYQFLGSGSYRSPL
jgi:hypothetical protein